MKNHKKYLPICALAICTVFSACEDEVLVPVEDETAVAELLESISSFENELFEYNLEKRTVTLENRKLKQTLDSIEVAHADFAINGNKITTVQYTVNVISASNYAQGRVSGITGATVTVQQGKFTETQETNSGLAVFKDLKEGEVYVTISSPNHTGAQMVVHLLSDGVYSSNADYYNASTRVILFPISGENTATLKGNIYANTSTLNDTLNRVYGSASIYGEKAGKFVAKPGIFPTGGNYTQQNEYNRVTGNPYYYYWSTPPGESVQFESVPASPKIYVVAKPALSLQPDFSNDETGNAGYIKSITYNDLIFEVQVNSDHSYSVEVPASAGVNLAVELYAAELIGDHTRFTTSHESAGPGTTNEAGSEKISFKYYNCTDYTRENLATIQEDGSIAYVIVEPNQSTTLSLYSKTEPFRYELRGPQPMGTHIHPKQVKYLNLYFWPVNR